MPIFVTLAIALCMTAAGPVLASPQSAHGVSGKVVETMNSGGYTYVKLKGADGETWAAVPQTKVAVGSDVTIEGPMAMKGFESKTLKRKFDLIYFGTLAGNGAPRAPQGSANPMGQMKMSGGMAGSPHGMGSSPDARNEDFKSIKVARAEGSSGKTVSEIYAQKSSLNGKVVKVRGKVVKYSPGIMGKNWIHLRDGSGSVEGKDFDLTVSMQDQAKVGDTVLVEGTVQADRDLGAGYKYSVLLENAKVVK